MVSIWSVARVFNEKVFPAEVRLVQRSTESRTTETGIGELGRFLENGQSKVIEEEMTILHSDLK
jgi:hypothetical protein